MKLSNKLSALLALLIALVAFSSVSAQDVVELRVLWYNDGNEGEVLRELLDRFEADNSDIRVILDTVPYADLHTTLQTQIETQSAPDLARINDVARFAGNYLELSTLVADSAYWTDNFPPAILASLRTGDDTTGLYGFPLQFSVTVPFVNRTLFEEAGVELPTADATWEEWVAAATEVAQATETPYAVAIDRTGHRFWGLSLPLGATYIGEDGTITVDSEGFRVAAQTLIDWHSNGLIPPDVWAGSGGSYVAAAEYFINGQVVFYYAGTWQIQNFTNNIADTFDWELVPNPAGEVSTGIPGGSAFVGLATTQHPAEVARVLDYLTQEDVLREFSERTLFIPGHLGLIESGVEYPASNDALTVALAEIPKISDQAYKLQYSPLTFALNVAIRERLSQVIVGELTLDEAIVEIQAEVDEAAAALETTN